MSIESMVVALHHSRSAGTTKLVLLGIANHDGDGGAWPSIATLAKYAACSERTVQRCIRDLADLGEVVISVQSGGTAFTRPGYRPNRYEITLTCPPDCAGGRKHERRADDETAGQAGVTRMSPLRVEDG